MFYVHPDQIQPVRSLHKQISPHEGDDLHIHVVVLNNGLPELHDLGVSALVDYQGDMEMHLGRQTDQVHLLRPDGYVAFNAKELNKHEIMARLKNWQQ